MVGMQECGETRFLLFDPFSGLRRKLSDHYHVTIMPEPGGMKKRSCAGGICHSRRRFLGSCLGFVIFLWLPVKRLRGQTGGFCGATVERSTTWRYIGAFRRTSWSEIPVR